MEGEVDDITSRSTGFFCGHFCVTKKIVVSSENMSFNISLLFGPIVSILESRPESILNLPLISSQILIRTFLPKCTKKLVLIILFSTNYLKQIRTYH